MSHKLLTWYGDGFNKCIKTYFLVSYKLQIYRVNTARALYSLPLQLKVVDIQSVTLLLSSPANSSCSETDVFSSSSLTCFMLRCHCEAHVSPLPLQMRCLSSCTSRPSPAPPNSPTWWSLRTPVALPTSKRCSDGGAGKDGIGCVWINWSEEVI